MYFISIQFVICFINTYCIIFSIIDKLDKMYLYYFLVVNTLYILQFPDFIKY